jgi:GrpB-like predicted nucleotidyltransferase (UPF0157 family)
MLRSPARSGPFHLSGWRFQPGRPRRRRHGFGGGNWGIEKRALVVEEYVPAWPKQYAVHETRIREALGDGVVRVEHIGSTAVPGLAAKPIIDILVEVPDITAEEEYLEPNDPAGHEYLLLRDHLRTDRSDRELYERTKKELAARDWPDMNAYADAKTQVIEQIKRRARAQS